LLLTDPPYNGLKRTLKLYEHLSALAGRVLVDGGSLLCLTGQSHLEKVLPLLCKNLRYHWTIACLYPQCSTHLQFKRLSPGWKPLLWFTKGQYKGDWMYDVIGAPKDTADKKHHVWGQSEHIFSKLIQEISNPGEVIFDPFTGGGVVPLAAIKARRRVHASDVSFECVDIVRERIRGLGFLV
jgi:DNA modification methylase